MHLSLSRYLLLALVLLMTAGCAGRAGQIAPRGRSESEIKAAQELSELNSKLLSQSNSAASSPSDYYIGPADLLEIKVFKAKELNTKSRVSSRGFITLPLLGAVPVENITARQVEERIENLLLQGGYMTDPGVSVYIAEHKSKQISVVGSVKNPGNFELLGRNTLVDALAKAGGLTSKAGRSAYLTRTDKEGKRQAFIIDLEQLLQRGNADLNLTLHPGDVVYVARSGNVFVEGGVKKPGSVAIVDGSTTLSQAIASAGGIASFADADDVRILRYLGGGKRDVIQVNLNDVREGKTDDILVKDRDAVVVGISGFKKFVYGLGLNLGFGLVGVSYAPPTE